MHSKEIILDGNFSQRGGGGETGEADFQQQRGKGSKSGEGIYFLFFLIVYGIKSIARNLDASEGKTTDSALFI